MNNKAVLYLKDGTLFEGRSFGWKGESCGEVVFNTAMTGYEEILTDPSYSGQIVAMCYPHIGNYGINSENAESAGVWVAGFIVKERSRIYSSYMAETGVDEYLEKHRVVGLEGIDTRFLVKKIRDAGSMPGIISAVDFDPVSLKEKLDRMVPISERDIVSEVNASENAAFRRHVPSDGPGKKIALIDFGNKLNIVRLLEEYGFSVRMLPGNSTLDDVMSVEPEGVLFSNGPGDPQSAPYGVRLARELLAMNLTRRMPMMGICLGHQLIALGAGGKTFKLKFGHHGGNHPVKNLQTGRIEITAQNHNYWVERDSLPDEFEETHLNLNDGTLEGMSHSRFPVIGCQYHPEGGPGPHDSRYIFGKFKELVYAKKN